MDVSVDTFAIIREQIEGLLAAAVALAPNLAAALIALAFTAALSVAVGRLAAKLLRSSRARPSLVVAIEKLVRIAVWLFGTLAAATILFPDLTPTKLLAGLGLGSLAVGLAFRDIFENFLAGFLILLRKPMRIGDDIECENLRGRVEAISMRDTFLRMRSGELILVPNSYIFKNPVKILTDRPIRRISIVVGVAYGEDVDAARDVIAEAMEGVALRAKDRPVDVFATEFNSSSIDFTVRWWTQSAPIDEHRSRDEAVAAVKAALDSAGIEIPFPYRTLKIPDPIRIERSDDP